MQVKLLYGGQLTLNNIYNKVIIVKFVTEINFYEINCCLAVVLFFCCDLICCSWKL